MRTFLKIFLLFITLTIFSIQAKALAVTGSIDVTGDRGFVTVTFTVDFEIDPNTGTRHGSYRFGSQYNTMASGVWNPDILTRTYRYNTTLHAPGEPVIFTLTATNGYSSDLTVTNVFVPHNEPQIDISYSASPLRGITTFDVSYSFPSTSNWYNNIGLPTGITPTGVIEIRMDDDPISRIRISLSSENEVSGVRSFQKDTTNPVWPLAHAQYTDGTHDIVVNTWMEWKEISELVKYQEYDNVIDEDIDINNKPEIIDVEVTLLESILRINANYSFPTSNDISAKLVLMLEGEEIVSFPPITLSQTTEVSGTTQLIYDFADDARFTEGSHDISLNSRFGVPLIPLAEFPYEGLYVGAITVGASAANRADEKKDKLEEQPPKSIITNVAEPINVATGNMHTTRTDISIPTCGMPLVLACTYNSQDNFDGMFGYGWHATYEYELLTASDGSLVAIDPDGVVTVYSDNGDGTYTPSAGKYSTLTKNADGTYSLLTKHGTLYMYSDDGKLTAITDRNGNNQTLLYDVSGVLYEVQASSGQSLSFTSNAEGKITSVTDPAGNVHTYAYDTEGNLISVTDPLGNVMTYEYDADHNITRKVDALGTSLYYVYDSEDRAVRNWQDGDVNLVELTYSGGVTTATDSLGRITMYHYNEYGLVESMIDALGNVEATVWDEDMNKTSVTDKNGNITAFSYDEMGNLTSTTDPTGAVSLFEYEPTFNQVTRSTDPLGNVTVFAYDGYGNLITQTDALGNATQYSYDAQGNVVSSTDANGNTTTFAYDAAGNLISTTDALGNMTTFAYDAVGNVLTITDALGNMTAFAYDALNRQTSITYADGAVVQFAYDAIGNRIQITDAKGTSTNFVYDAYSRLVQNINGLGAITSYAYDPEGNQVSVTDANGNVTQYQYDALDRVIYETTPLGNTTAYTYDAVGNRVMVTDPKGQSIAYTYDARNLLTMITYPDASAVQFDYDAAGRRTGMTDAQGPTVYSYDALGRLISVDGPEAVDTILYEYDAAGNRIQMVDQEGGITGYGYDALNRLIRVTDPEGMDTAYTYDAVSNVVKMVYPNGAVADHTYDNRNRIIELMNKKDDLPVDVSLTNVLCVYEYEYDLNGMRTKTTLKNEAWIGYEYDAINQLVREEKERINQNDAQVTRYLYEYTYDAVGNRVHMKRMFNKNLFWRQFDGSLPTEVVTFLETYHFGAKDSEYDGPHENRSTEYERWPIIETGYVYNAENALLVLNEDLTYQGSFFDIKDTSFTYDANGNMVEESQATGPTTQVTTYGYDYENRLVSVDIVPAPLNVVPAEAGIQYQYDGTGKRIYALEAGIETHYYYDGLVPVIERDAAGVLSAQTVRGIGYGGGIGSVISRTASFINDKGKLKYKKLYYHYDGVGNVVKLSNKNAGGAGAYAYDAFGNDLSTENNNTENNPYEFATKETSAVTGLVYFGARYYDPSIGRWITKDPMGMIDGPNLYAYVGNSPVNFVDPWGLCKEDTDDKSLLEKIQDLLHDNRIDLATAREIARRLLKEFNTHNDIGDALRHAEWSRQMAAEINQLTAYVVGVGHEIENMIQGQPINEMRMDLHNNAEGRRAAQENRSIDVDNLVSNPGGNDSWPY